MNEWERTRDLYDYLPPLMNSCLDRSSQHIKDTLDPCLIIMWGAQVQNEPGLGWPGE